MLLIFPLELDKLLSASFVLCGWAIITFVIPPHHKRENPEKTDKKIYSLHPLGRPLSLLLCVSLACSRLPSEPGLGIITNKFSCEQQKLREQGGKDEAGSAPTKVY